MGFQVSPGVVVTEKDLTTIVPAVSTTDGAFVGFFRWGPVNDVELIGDENQLVKQFGKPDNDTASSFFTAANFLAYGNKLRLVRVIGDNAKNSSCGSETVIIKNDEDYLARMSDLNDNDLGEFIAKFPGRIGNTLKVSICQSSSSFKRTIAGTVSSGIVEVDGQSLPYIKKTNNNPISFDTELTVGSFILDDGGLNPTRQQRQIVEIKMINILGVDTEVAILDRKLDTQLSNATISAIWEYADAFGIAPGTSTFATTLAKKEVNDEMHIVIVDVEGLFSGTPGTILERYSFLSKASDAKKEDGSSAYYVNVINTQSDYIRFAAHSDGTDWGRPILPLNDTLPVSLFTPLSDESTAPISKRMRGGDDHNDNAEGQLNGKRILGYDLFANAELVDVSLVLLGEASQSVIIHVINNICESRKDCVAFISPPKDKVVNNDNAAEDIIDFRDSLPSSSYAVMDSGWKYQYDKYNDIFRYVPLNGDVAGLCVRTDQNEDPWYSPAGYNRGNIKNVIKLAFNPFKAERDDLYLKGINPVISTQGLGTILFGDKTLLAKPSAFDRINVRRLFIVLEKAIAKASKFMLFEFNDEFTRQQFRSLVEPFLRNVQARRGIYDFKVVCDRTNNTPEVIDRNEFIGDIYIKPARSINFIQLNFVAVRTGVDFSEIVGKV